MRGSRFSSPGDRHPSAAQHDRPAADIPQTKRHIHSGPRRVIKMDGRIKSAARQNEGVAAGGDIDHDMRMLRREAPEPGMSQRLAKVGSTAISRLRPSAGILLTSRVSAPAC